MSINLERHHPPCWSWFGAAEVYSDMGVGQWGDVSDLGPKEVWRGLA